MLRVLHGSDVHFGKPHRPSVATAFLEMVRTVGPDVIVLAGRPHAAGQGTRV